MRTVSWFSCGAASAVATKLALLDGPTTIAYCEVKEEHPDNKRFLKECEEWFGQEVVVLGNDKYDRSAYNVFEKERYLVGPMGAHCTGVLKKELRHKFADPYDRNVLGYTCEEQHRITKLQNAEPVTNFWPILIERGMSKQDCHALLANAGIESPMMYKMGYRNNNCIGCVKGGMGYWNKIRLDFPETFAKAARIERDLNASINRKDGEKVFLDELDPQAGNYKDMESIECGIFCHMAEQDIDANTKNTESTQSRRVAL